MSNLERVHWKILKSIYVKGTSDVEVFFKKKQTNVEGFIFGFIDVDYLRIMIKKNINGWFHFYFLKKSNHLESNFEGYGNFANHQN